jgi:polysaccharide biosynthesis transport protein
VKELAHSSFQSPSPPDRGDAELLPRSMQDGSMAMQEEGISLRNYWQVIRKHLRLIAVFCFGTVLIAALVIMMMTPIYTAETVLLIERNTPQVLDIREVLSDPPGMDESNFYKTQYEILKSRTLAAWVIREQGLETNSILTGEGNEKGFVARLWAKAKRRVSQQEWARRFFPQLLETGEDNPLGVSPALIDAYMEMLEIKPVLRTRLVKIALNTPDPKLSARLANAHAQAYIRQGLGLRTRANEEAERFLEEKLGELKGRIERSEAALNSYRRDREIISLDDKENIVVERLADLNRRLTESEADRIALEAQVHLIRKRAYDWLPAVINSPLIGTLKGELARLEGEYASLSKEFKPGYTRLDQLQAQVEESRRRLRQEIQRVVSGIESSYLAAQTRERSLRDKMEEQKATTLGLKDAAVEYATLTREVDTNRQLYDSVLQRMKETGVAAELRASNVSIIDTAVPPRKPSKPKKAQSFLLSALIGLIGGVGLAWFFEYLDNAIKTPEEVERYLRLPNLGVVPDFSSLNGRRYGPRRLPYAPPQLPGSLASGEGPVQVLFHHPFSVVTEAYRTVRTAILLSRAGESPKTILFTSGIHGEGKTVSVLNTAFVFAQMGVRVLVIDADLRRPSCHRLLRMDRGFGLTEVLTGQRGLKEVIRPTALDHLSFLSAGSPPPNPAELVGSKTMQETIASLQAHYDYILIDSPPVMQVSDAVLLSTMVEGVVLVVSSQQTPRGVVREAHARLRYARAKLLGVVLNRVNLRGEDYAYYYGSYAS